MQTILRSKLYGACLTIALMVALGAIGLAHRVVTPDSAARYAFVLAGGDLSGLCGDAHEDGRADRGDCPACHIVKAFDLPVQLPALADDAPHLLAIAIVAPDSRVAWRVRDPAHGMRAPPVA